MDLTASNPLSVSVEEDGLHLRHSEQIERPEQLKDSLEIAPKMKRQRSPNMDAH